MATFAVEAIVHPASAGCLTSNSSEETLRKAVLFSEGQNSNSTSALLPLHHKCKRGSPTPNCTTIVCLDNVTNAERESRRKSTDEILNNDVENEHYHRNVDLGGHVNILFSYDEDLSPGMRVQYGQEIGGHGSGFGLLQDVTDVLCIAPSNILVTDLVNNRLQMFNKSGRAVISFQADEIVEPWACTVTLNGHLAVTSRKTRCVVLLNRAGCVDGTFGEEHLVCPCGIATTDEGHFIVTDFVKNKVLVFTGEGNFLQELGGGRSGMFNQPRYVTVSRQGDIIISDSGSHQLKIFDKNWKFVRSIGGYGKQDGRLKFPHATCTDSYGNIMVCDRYNDRVSVFTRKGEFVRHLVTSAHGVHHPQGLALSPELKLYISHGGLKASRVMVLHLKLEDDSNLDNRIHGRLIRSIESSI